MSNELLVGSRRTGSLYDGMPDTPDVHVTLERSEDRILVHVPWNEPKSPYASWFLTQMESATGDGVSAPVPKQLLFRDSHGMVLLVGCRAAGYRANVGGPGTGVVTARYAIMLDGHSAADFIELHGVKSEVSGLRSWLGVTSIKINRLVEGDGANCSMGLTLQVAAADPVEVLPGGQLSFMPSWRQDSQDDRDTLTVHDRLLVQTITERPKPWTGLTEDHLAMRDLMILSRWLKVSCVINAVTHDGDPMTTLDGKSHGRQWRPVVQADGAVESTPSIYGRPHLIGFADVGVAGVRRWLTLRAEYARALDPIISCRLMDHVTPLALLTQVGPGLEALGYLCLMRDGSSKKGANSANFEHRLRRIVRDVEDLLPFDGDKFTVRTATAYNGVKHINREMPAEVDVLNAWRECVLLARAWVAVELGVDRTAVKERLALDPQSDPYIKVE